MCDNTSCKITEVKETCLQPVTGLVSKLVFAGSIPALHKNQGESMVASYRYLEVSNPGLQKIGSKECDVSYL